ncbi:MAG: family transcriptional regulator [Evtepia sp.]|jgi:transcriptional regulator with XRE-family HTH domain|nr:family transcriptional regulator [Evtepia sp.]
MKEINIAKVLVTMRKENGITQEELANYMGVSKASVSKWETEQSYPDITLLPLLATYFNISIDELIDYHPQMTKGDIQKLYRRLSADFASKPFDSVLGDCRAILKKYYSCFPLLLQMGSLMVNHVELLQDKQKADILLAEAKALFVRVKEESDDVSLKKQALYMEAFCNLVSGEAPKVLELLDGTIAPALPPESLLASAYQMTGRIKEAKSVLQVGIYQNIIVLFNFFPAYLTLCMDDAFQFDEVLRRAFCVAEAFDMRHLHPGVLVGLYLSAAQGYLVQENHDKALAMLQHYAEIVTSDIYPLLLHGDDFFDLLESWMDQLDLGCDLPRDEKTIRKSMVTVIAQNPAFSELSQDVRFQSILDRLQSLC